MEHLKLFMLKVQSACGCGRACPHPPLHSQGEVHGHSSVHTCFWMVFLGKDTFPKPEKCQTCPLFNMERVSPNADLEHWGQGLHWDLPSKPTKLSWSVCWPLTGFASVSDVADQFKMKMHECHQEISSVLCSYAQRDNVVFCYCSGTQ